MLPAVLLHVYMCKRRALTFSEDCDSYSPISDAIQRHHELLMKACGVPVIAQEATLVPTTDTQLHLFFIYFIFFFWGGVNTVTKAQICIFAIWK